MRKIKNREQATEWHLEQEKEESRKKTIEDQIDLLSYAALKRKTGYPSANALRNAGLVNSAELLTKAYLLIEEAHIMALAESSAIKNI